MLIRSATRYRTSGRSTRTTGQVTTALNFIEQLLLYPRPRSVDRFVDRPAPRAEHVCGDYSSDKLSSQYQLAPCANPIRPQDGKRRAWQPPLASECPTCLRFRLRGSPVQVRMRRGCRGGPATRHAAPHGPGEPVVADPRVEPLRARVPNGDGRSQLSAPWGGSGCGMCNREPFPRHADRSPCATSRALVDPLRPRPIDAHIPEAAVSGSRRRAVSPRSVKHGINRKQVWRPTLKTGIAAPGPKPRTTRPAPRAIALNDRRGQGPRRRAGRAPARAAGRRAPRGSGPEPKPHQQRTSG